MTNTIQSIKTNHLEIKPYGAEDRMAMVELLTNEEIKETFMIPDFSSEEQVINLFERLKLNSHSETIFERGIYLKDQLIGFVNEVERSEDHIELGYVIHPMHKSNGYASEMLRSVIEELFRQGHHKVVAGAFEENEASFKVMQKCGMKMLDKEEEISYRGVTHRCLYYGIER